MLNNATWSKSALVEVGLGRIPCFRFDENTKNAFLGSGLQSPRQKNLKVKADFTRLEKIRFRAAVNVG